MEKKSNKMLIIVLSLIIIALIAIVLVLLFKDSSILEKDSKNNQEISKKEDNVTNTKNEVDEDEEDESADVIKVSDICGVYRQISESDDEEIEEIVDELQLYENGMFHFTHEEHTAPGYIGNYYIEDNKIILNVLFEHGSDVALTVVGEIYELEIDEDENIIGKNLLDNKSKVELERVTDGNADLEELQEEIIDWIKNSAKESLIISE